VGAGGAVTAADNEAVGATVTVADAVAKIVTRNRIRLMARLPIEVFRTAPRNMTASE